MSPIAQLQLLARWIEILRPDMALYLRQIYANASGNVLARGGNNDSAITAAEVINCILARYLSELEHSLNYIHRCGQEWCEYV